MAAVVFRAAQQPQLCRTKHDDRSDAAAGGASAPADGAEARRAVAELAVLRESLSSLERQLRAARRTNDARDSERLALGQRRRLEASAARAAELAALDGEIERAGRARAERRAEQCALERRAWEATARAEAEAAEAAAAYDYLLAPVMRQLQAAADERRAAEARCRRLAGEAGRWRSGREEHERRQERRVVAARVIQGAWRAWARRQAGRRQRRAAEADATAAAQAAAEDKRRREAASSAAAAAAAAKKGGGKKQGGAKAVAATAAAPAKKSSKGARDGAKANKAKGKKV